MCRALSPPPLLSELPFQSPSSRLLTTCFPRRKGNHLQSLQQARMETHILGRQGVCICIHIPFPLGISSLKKRGLKFKPICYDSVGSSKPSYSQSISSLVSLHTASILGEYVIPETQSKHFRAVGCRISVLSCHEGSSSVLPSNDASVKLYIWACMYILYISTPNWDGILCQGFFHTDCISVY